MGNVEIESAHDYDRHGLENELDLRLSHRRDVDG